MPAAIEQVIPKPLSGEEIRQIILGKLAAALNGDTRLADYVAFPSFRYRLDLHIILETKVEEMSKIDVQHEGGRGPETVGDTANVQAVFVHQEQQEMPPNEARVEAGLGVPVQTHDEKGRPVEKLVKYGKEQVRGARQK